MVKECKRGITGERREEKEKGKGGGGREVKEREGKKEKRIKRKLDITHACPAKRLYDLFLISHLTG